MRYLGLDFGSKTLGIALSDETATIASSLKVIRYIDTSELIKELKIIMGEFNIKAIVLGFPINMNGSSSTRSVETIEFRNKIQRELKIKVHLQDERFSTVEAEKILISGKIRRKNRKKVIDSIAATIILQTFLNRMKVSHE